MDFEAASADLMNDIHWSPVLERLELENAIVRRAVSPTSVRPNDAPKVSLSAPRSFSKVISGSVLFVCVRFTATV
jgi:hypothetical protein